LSPGGRRLCRFVGLEQLGSIGPGARNAETAQWMGVARLTRSERALGNASRLCATLFRVHKGLTQAVKAEHALSVAALGKYNKQVCLGKKIFIYF
jgi:hypothetical protein